MDNFSNLMMINECLLDKKRVALFTKAVLETVKIGDTVLDAGSGSGILSFLALKAGARKVYSVEIDPAISEIIKNNAVKLGYSRDIEIINQDVKKVNLPPVDVVIMEMLDTWLVAEQELPAINALVNAGVIGKTTSVIPAGVRNYIQFVDYDFNFYGFYMPQPVQARNFGVMGRIKSTFSTPLFVDKIDLNKLNSPERTGRTTFISKYGGTINAAVLKTKLLLTKTTATWGTTDMNMPVIVPLKPLSVMPGQQITTEISYTAATGFDAVHIELS